jgi:hypothetical protein
MGIFYLERPSCPIETSYTEPNLSQQSSDQSKAHDTIRLVFKTNSKFFIQIPNSHSSVIGNHTHEALAYVTDIVVVVKELDVFLDCFCCRVSATVSRDTIRQTKDVDERRLLL